ncbi:hypothetical protein BN946_scf184868.g21 [Trametes cinnabarina]|uniref:Aminoglycoside phosphotransferase domain-containing protein n=1 Tax=Pycnoporus cinnabarinus TaxID=5643 RepID=A0A060SPY0_PYCCI|nr:hypothetical protein BN946_scf184868.g21 [Trametes cinnabarina]
MQKIATYVDQLRAIPQPPPTPGSNLPLSGWIGSPLGHAFRDFAMTQASFSFGPFASQRAFYDWRVSRFREIGNRHQPTAARIAQISQTMPCTHPIVFTHGDINRRNVLVRVHGNGPDDIEVTAILDWEQAGWRPIYWESFKWLFEDGSTPGWAEFGTTQIGAQYEAAVALEFELQSISGYIPS